MKKFLIILISATLFLFSHSFAEEQPAICNQSPEFLDNYLSTVVNILNTPDKNKKNTPSWLKWLWSKIIQPSLWWAAVLWLFWGIWTSTFLYNFIVIFKQQYIVRDWVKLINFEQYISKKYLELARNWTLSNNIPKEILDKVNKSPYLILKFQWKTYNDLLFYLWKNQKYLENIFFYTVVLKKKDFSLNKDFLNFNLTLKNDSYRTNLENKLEKAYPNRDHVCSPSLIQALKNLANIKKLSENFEKIWKNFTCNLNRLKEALWISVSWNTNCWSVKLVKDWKFWVKWKVNIEWVWKIALNATANNTWDIITMDKWMKKALNYIWNTISAAKNAIKNFFSDNNTKDKNPKISFFSAIKDSFKWEKKSDVNISNKNEQLFTDKINSIWTTINTNYNLASTDLSKLNTNSFFNWVWPEFVKLSKSIWKWICTIDNEYEWCDSLENISSQDWIYQNMVKTCENQSPHLWNCRYIPYLNWLTSGF